MLTVLVGQVSWSSDGSITYTAPSSAAPVTLSYTVSDGHAGSTVHPVALTVVGTGDTVSWPPVANDDVVHVVAGQSATISPLTNDIFGADPTTPSASLQIAGPVSPDPATPDLQVATDQTGGKVVVTASAQAAGTYLLPYYAGFGSTASAQPAKILVVVTKPPTALPPAPVTVPVSVVTHGAAPATADVLASDSDPAGGLLTVTDVSPSAAQATIVQGRYVRVSVDRRYWSAPAPIPVTYTVSDGISSSEGQVLVSAQPPLASAHIMP